MFSIATCLCLVPGVYLGWSWNGVVGVAWVFLLSRVIPISQDLFVIHLVKAGGGSLLERGNTWRCRSLSESDFF